MQGQQHLEKDELDQAVATFKKAIDLNPTQVSGYSGLAAAHLSLQQFDEAISVAGSGIANDPDFPNIYGIRAQALLNKGDLLSAKKNLGMAIDIFKKCDADGWVNLYKSKLDQLWQ